jgi:hypothetical protein
MSSSRRICVERAGLDVATAFTDQADDPLAELAGRLVGERDRQDLPGRDPLDPDQIGDPVGEDPGLAGAGSRQDEERALGRRDRPRLLRVEGAQDLRFALGASLGEAGRIRRRCAGLGIAPGADGSGVTQPGRFLDDAVDDLVDGGPDRVRGGIDGRVAATATGGGTHLPILAPRARRPVSRRPGPDRPAGP